MISRRVIRKGNIFYCGICKSPHSSKDNASKCVDSCFKRKISQDGLGEKKNKKIKKYRCNFCKRVYIDLNEAQDCVSSCKEEQKKKRLREKSFEEISKNNLASKAKALAEISQQVSQQYSSDQAAQNVVKTGNSYQCLKCKELYKDYQSAFTCAMAHAKPKNSYLSRVIASQENKKTQKEEPEHTTSSQENINEVSRSTSSHNIRWRPPSLEIEEESLNSESEEQYEKKGDNFICRLCNSSYKTRKEVISCYQDHRKATSTTSSAEAPSLADIPEEDSLFEDLGEISAAKDPEVPEYKLADDANIPDKQKFKRDGAKYVCKKCNRKHFTRIEVIECFNYNCPTKLPSEA